MRLEDNRREYSFAKLTRESLLNDPFAQFESWINQALEAKIQDPTAMSLSTVNSEGKPWQRIVLLKHFDSRGFVFYTNLSSRKAGEIENNPNVCLHFPWLQLDRQVIVGGSAERLSTTEVVKYFLSRPQGSQLAAWASKQSSVISSRQVLEQQFNKIKQKLVSLIKKNQNLKDEIETIKDDDEYVEHIARENFGLIMDGEEYIIEDPE